ncbi:MAG: D-alanine--D-alanine ligase [Acidobacteria bacterium]|nr:D-alanine--D-alanine ligase [Acidobacteriota bacterium]
MSNRSVLLLAGGFSPERNVSLSSASNVAAHLRLAGHQANVLDVSGGVLTASGETEFLEGRILDAPTPEQAADLRKRTDIFALMQSEMIRSAEVIFPLIHGAFGEDGRLPALLDLAGVPYVGSDLVGQALSINKNLAKELFAQAGIPTPAWTQVVKHEPRTVPASYPVVVKPANGGSTIGMSLCRSEDRLEAALEHAFEYDAEAVVEQFIEGRELTVGILDGEALAIGEIRSAAAIFDYQAKYQSSQTEEIFPASLPGPLSEQIRRIAKAVNRVLRLRHYCRIDFVVDQKDRVFVLEANSVPGMTKRSLFPQSAGAAGLRFDDVCNRLCQMACRDWQPL